MRYRSEPLQLTPGIREQKEECHLLHDFQTQSVRAAMTSPAQNKRTGPRIFKEKGGPVCLAVTGEASPALEHQEPPSPPSNALETGAGLRGVVSACDFLQLSALASRVSLSGKNDSTSFHLPEAPADVETGWPRQRWKV